MVKKYVLKALKAITIICIALLVIFWQRNIAVASQFSRTCTNIAYEFGTFLVADCRRIDGSFRNAEIDLNNFIQNRDGNLAWDNNGGRYNETCQGCHIGVMTKYV